jgi:hypothetical protein
MTCTRIPTLLAILASVALRTSAALAAEPLNFKQTHYFKLFGLEEAEGVGERAGYEADNRAYPSSYVDPSVTAQAAAGAQRLLGSGYGHIASWNLVGPSVGTVPGAVTYTGRATTVSGRVTSLAISPHCSSSNCVLLVGSAGGGVWMTRDALSRAREWKSLKNNLPSNAIGSLAFDPSNWLGRTIYAGTGEANGSSDSEAGLGLFRSDNLGEQWQLVPGSVAVAAGRAISAVAIDPQDARHIFIGTAVARHGSSTVNGGRFTPPGAPRIGLYESTDSGASFRLVFSVASDAVDPNSPNGADFFRGGVSKLVLSRTGLTASEPTRAYFSVFGYGLYRSKTGGGL